MLQKKEKLVTAKLYSLSKISIESKGFPQVMDNASLLLLMVLPPPDLKCWKTL